MEKQTFILFKRSGQNVKHSGPLYEAIGAYYTTREQASETMVTFAEDDHNTFADDNGNIPGIMDKGDITYGHDSRDYTFLSIEEMDENDAEAALASSAISDNEKEEILSSFPNHRPE